MFNPGQFSSQYTSSKGMFDFTPSSPTLSEDKNLSKDELRSILTNVTDKKAALKKLESEGYIIEGLSPAPAPASQTGGFGQAVQNISAGIASGASQAVGGTLGIVGDFLSAPFSEDVSIGGIFTGKNTGGLGQLARDETARQQQAGARAFGADTESMGYKAGKMGTGLALSVATPGGVLGAAGKGAGLATRAGLGAVQGGIETGKFLGLTEGRLGTGKELATGAAFGAALPVLGAGLGKARETITKKLPESLIATGIATPTKLLNASERLNKLGDESFKDATSASKWLLKNKITGDIEQRTAQLDALATKGRETAQNLLKGSKVVVADDIVTQVKAGLASLRPKLESAGLTKYTTMIDDFANKQVWTAEDLNKARTFMADKGGIFKHSGDWVDSLQKENLQDIWKAASQYLDNAIPGFRAGNKDYEVASALSEAIKLKSAQDQARQVFSLVNVAGAGLGGIAGGLTGNDPLSVLQNAAIGAGLGLAGRAIFSPSNMSKLAVKLSEYAPKAEATKATKAIELFVKSRGENPLPQSVMNLIAKANKKLGDPFKDIAFIKKMQKGEVKGLSKEALDAMQGVKTVKEAMQKAKSAGVEDEIRRVYPLEGSRFDLSKNKKGFLQVGKVDDELLNEARKYKSAEEFIEAQGAPVYHGTKQQFDTFSSEKLGSNTKAESAKEGFFFTDNIENANHYTKKVIDSANYDVAGKIIKDGRFRFQNNYSSRTVGTGNNISALDFGNKPLTEKGILKLASDNFDNEILEIKKEITDSVPPYLQKENFIKLDKIAKDKPAYMKIWADNMKLLSNTGNPEIKEVVLFYKKPFIVNADESNSLGGSGNMQSSKFIDTTGKTHTGYANTIRYAKENGYDAVIMNNVKDPIKANNTIVFEPEQIKTKKQLQDIYNKATK